MLKGSYVTRQYFPNPQDRIPADLDWVYLGKLPDEAVAREKFDEWAIAVTESTVYDDVKFRSFKENSFWRSIDYAMADDFPTVNTDLSCIVDDNNTHLQLDISFNLDIEYPPVPMTYKPLRGKPFTIPYTAPLSLQVSWKIHQTLVRPRFKDLLDLQFLVQHPDFTATTLQQSLQALVNECNADDIATTRITDFLTYDLEKLFGIGIAESTWELWRHNKEPDLRHRYVYVTERAGQLTDISKLPESLTEFTGQFKTAMQKAGFDIHLADNLPMPTSNKRKSIQNKPSTVGEPVSFVTYKDNGEPPVKKGIGYIIGELLHRQFEEPDIRQYLVSLGHSQAEIDKAFADVRKLDTEVNPDAVTPRQGLSGFLYIVSGILFLLLNFGLENIRGDKDYNTLKIAIGVLFIVGGIIKVTRPLKK